MDYNQLQAIEEDFEVLNGNLLQVDDHTSIKNKIALPIVVSNSYDRTNDVVISYPKGASIGKIKFTKGTDTEDFNGLPEELQICFFTDYKNETIVSEKHTFDSDYLIINKRNYKKYKKEFKTTSSIWGSLFHYDDIPSITFEEKRVSGGVKTIDSLVINNSIYTDNLYLSVIEPNPFNRFLKLYHLLELQFDMHTAATIKTLIEDGGKEKEISSRLKEYSREELPRLMSIIRDKCTDLVSLADKMNNVYTDTSRAEKIFYEYGKPSNPLKKQSTFRNIGGLADKYIDVAGVDGLVDSSYSMLIPKLIAYWIYRVRCSIAHNKFGEYIMDKDDEKFIVQFAEPLLKEVVAQNFKA